MMYEGWRLTFSLRRFAHKRGVWVESAKFLVLCYVHDRSCWREGWTSGITPLPDFQTPKSLSETIPLPCNHGTTSLYRQWHPSRLYLSIIPTGSPGGFVHFNVYALSYATVDGQDKVRVAVFKASA